MNQPGPSRRVILTDAVLIGIVLMLAGFAASTLPAFWDYLRNPADAYQRIREAGASPGVSFLLKLFLAHLMLGGLLGLAGGAVSSLLFPVSKRKSAALASTTYMVLLVSLAQARLAVLQPHFIDPFLNGRSRYIFYFLTDYIKPQWLTAAFWLLIIVSATALLIRFPRKAAIAFVLAFAVVLASFWATGIRKKAKSSGPGMNVLMIGFDSLRSDRLATEGYTRKVIPNVDALVGSGLCFPNTYVSLARTFPAMVSILSSEYPHTHGVRYMFPRRETRYQKRVTLASVLSEKGYHTSVLSDYAGEMFGDIDLGFSRRSVPQAFSLPIVIRREILIRQILLLPFINNRTGRKIFPTLDFLPINSDPRVLGKRLRDEIAATPPGKNFFIFAFFSASHAPYASVYPYYKMYTDPEYKGAKRYSARLERLEQIHEVASSRETSAQEQKNIIALYDGSLRSIDDELGATIKYLEAVGLKQKTLVVILSDHGEHFYEYGTLLGHGDQLTGGDGDLRIPLVLNGPRILEGREIRQRIREIDLAPTILEILGIKAPSSFEGRSALLFLIGQEWKDRPIFAETGIWLDPAASFSSERLLYPSLEETLEADPADNYVIVLKKKYNDVVIEAKHRMLLMWPYKLVYMPLVKGARFSLYNEVDDPGNSNDISQADPERTRQMKGNLIDWMTSQPGWVWEDEHLVPKVQK